MKNLMKPLVAAGCLALLAAAATGCKCTPPGPARAYAIEVSLADDLKSSSVIVDLVGINKANLPRWESYPMGDYWKQNDPMRQDAVKNGTAKVLNFVSGQTNALTLPMKDPLWDKWKSLGVTHVMVLADLPHPPSGSAPGDQDPRRHTLPLGKCVWRSGTSTLKVLVQRSGITVLTEVNTP
jgi:hypothetical protein